MISHRLCQTALSCAVPIYLCALLAPQAAPAQTVLNLVPDSSCPVPAGLLTISINLSGASVPIVGGQFLLSFDPAVLTLVSIDPGDPPFVTEIHESVDPVLGLIDYAGGIAPAGHGTAADTTMARAAFLVHPATEACDVASLVAFRANDPPTRLIDANDTVYSAALGNVTLNDLPAVSIDAIQPVIVPPPNVAARTSAGSCAALLDPGLPTVSDNCTPAVDIVVTFVRSDGAPLLTDAYNAADSPVTILWTAIDACGRQSQALSSVTVAVLGDLDGDNIVGLADLSVQLANFGTTSGARPEDGDLDGDGDVDLGDLAVMLTAFGADCR